MKKKGSIYKYSFSWQFHKLIMDIISYVFSIIVNYIIPKH